MSCICTKNIYKFKPLPSWNFDCSNSWYQTGNLRSNKCWWTCKISEDSFFHALFEIRFNWNPEVSVTWVSWTVRNQVLANDATHHSCLFTVGVVTDFLNQRSKEFFLNYSVRLSHYGWAKVKQHKCSVDSCFWCVVKKTYHIIVAHTSDHFLSIFTFGLFWRGVSWMEKNLTYLGCYSQQDKF